jgi:DNA-binding IscR family transcriptional regulator
MKLKSETKQVVEFLKQRANNKEKTVTQACTELGINFDMVQRALILLHREGIISRDTRGPRSAYQYPDEIGLGDIIKTVDGLDCFGGVLGKRVLETLNSVKI